ncbi:MAG: DUF3408 domain-containing protein [Prevotella sp.]|nr:DUF3408 domain-containing protein [Prevotella sp.]
MEKPVQKTEQEKKEVETATVVADTPIVQDTDTVTEAATIEPTAEPEEPMMESTPKVYEPTAKPVEKRKRKPQADYQSLFFNRIDFTNRKPLYITAVTHRRLMRIVHLYNIYT